MRVVRGCLTCGGSEHPQVTFTALYRDGQGDLQFSWVCQECVGALGVERLRDLTEADIFCRNDEMRRAHKCGQTVWTGDCPPGLVLRPFAGGNSLDSQAQEKRRHAR